MGLRPRAFLAGSLGFAVAFVVACGGGNGLLSGPQASGLNSKLNAVSSAVGAGHCGSARGAAQAFQSQVAALPSTINSTLANNLSQGATTLSELANRGCSSSTTSHSTSPSSTTSSPSQTSTSISTTTVTNSSTPTSSTNPNTATNPGGTGTSTTSNGSAGIGQTTGAGGN